MKALIACVVIGLVGFSSAAPSNSYVVHEKRDHSAHESWVLSNDKINSDVIIPLSISLTQQNIDKGYDFLMDVSDPVSPNYGQHWSLERISETFAATDETITDVKSWLFDSGISGSRLKVSMSKTWIHMNVTVEEAESLLKTEYKIYVHAETAKRSLAVNKYSVPAAIKRHIDFIIPTVDSDAFTLKKIKPKRDVLPDSGSPFSNPPRVNLAGLPAPQAPGNFEGTLQAAASSKVVATNDWAWNLTVCPEFVTPACIRELYNAPNGTLDISSYAVVEYNDEYFNQTDLGMYLFNLNPEAPTDTGPTVFVIPDTVFVPALSGDDIEGNLDIQLATAIVYPQQMTYYQANSNDIFLDAIDASYCSIFPSPDCGTIPAADVWSTSWSFGTDAISALKIRQCNEYMKLGLNGKTLLFSSGDSGVGCSRTGAFQATWPSACPYVTSVGATQIPPGGTVTDNEIAATGFGSGGGFSTFYATPDYQQTAVSKFWELHNPDLPASAFNLSTMQRGYPDVAANGWFAIIVAQGEFEGVGGTSESSPIFGGIITLINEQRLAAGKSTVGFINPVLYANPAALNDITVGNNTDCTEFGFFAVKGWDPVTGLGTPDYKKLLNVWMRLP